MLIMSPTHSCMNKTRTCKDKTLFILFSLLPSFQESTTDIHSHAHTITHSHTHSHTCIHTHTHACVWMYMYVHVYACVCTCMCMCVNECACVNHTHTNTENDFPLPIPPSPSSSRTQWKKCTFSGDGEFIVAGSHRQHALYIWDKGTGSLAKMLTGQKGETLLDIAVSGSCDNHMLYATGEIHVIL